MENEQVVIEELPETMRPSGWKTFRRVMTVILLLLCLAGGTAAGVGLYIADGLTPVEASDTAVRVIIPRGIGSGDIAVLLEENGLIRNGFIFKYYLRFHRQGARFQAGEYEMIPGMKLEQIVGMLNKGETVKEETIRFTIPEGYSLEQIVEVLGEAELADRQKLLDVLLGTSSLQGEAILNIPDNPKMKYKLEGYLFPETYEMKKGSSELEIINRMLVELDHKLSGLPQGWQEKMEENGVTFHEMLTIASLVEREVVVEEERPLIAGIIYNRLKEPMNLQIDATVQYVLKEQKERLLFKDLEINSPYNTYLYEGLPPGPIASPSLSSIEAAIYPEDNEYLFYVTKKDGSQAHLFAKTFKQHQANIKKSNSD
ncbi:MAG TPA: endolytic transglycosylase MltG [Bacilli bacterium]